MVFSALRDDFPWLYELGVQLYRAIEADDERAIERARKTLMKTIEMTRHSPFFHEILGEGPGYEEAMMLLHHFARDIDRFISRPKRARSATLVAQPKAE